MTGTITNPLHNDGKWQQVIAEGTGGSQSAVSKHIYGKLAETERCGRNKQRRGDDCTFKKIVKPAQFSTVNCSRSQNLWSYVGALVQIMDSLRSCESTINANAIQTILKA